MLTLTGQLTEYMDVCHDDTAENKARGIRRMNQFQREICALDDFWWLEKAYTFLTVASTQSYNLPILWRKIKTVTVTVSNIIYPITEVVNPMEWDYLNSRGTQVTSDYPRYYHIRNNIIYFYPTFSSSSLTVTIEYLRRPTDMLTEDYSTGTIAVTNGDETVTGSGTTWTSANNIRAGNFIFIDYIPYEVASITDSTHLELVQKYQGTTASGLAYKIGDVSLINEDFHDILWKNAAKDYFSVGKEDQKLYTLYSTEVGLLLDRLKQATRSRSTNNIIKPQKVNNLYQSRYDLPLT